MPRFLTVIFLLLLIPAKALAFNPVVLFDTWKLDDGGFIQAAHQGVLSFEKFEKTTVAIITSRKDEGPGRDLAEMTAEAAEKGFDPIVGVGFSFANAFEAVALKFPDTRFVIVDAIASGPNIESIIFREEEGAYLMGYLAAMASRSKKIGFVGGMDIELIRKFACAYAQGAEARDPLVIVYSAMTGDTNEAWLNPAKGAELTRGLVDKGVDVVFHAAGMTGDGVIQAAREEGILAIGVDSNQNYMAPDIMLTSMLKRTDVAIFMALSRIRNGIWKPGVVSLGVKEGGIDWAVDKHNIILLTPEMQRTLGELTFHIMAGTFKVFVYTEDKGCPYLDLGPSAGD